MQPLQQTQRVRNRLQVRGRLAGQFEILAAVAAERLRHAKRMKQSEPMPELEQVLVVDREQRALERRKHRQLIVWPFDRREGGADRLDLFAAVKRLAADQQMRNAARLDRVHIAARDVVTEADEPPEQHRDVPRLQRHPRFRAVRLLLGDGPAALVRQPRDIRARPRREASRQWLCRMLSRRQNRRVRTASAPATRSPPAGRPPRAGRADSST